MTVRQLDKTGKAMAQVAVATKNRPTGSVSGENFAHYLDSFAEVAGSETATTESGITPDEPSLRQKHEQLRSAGDLLDSLEALESGLIQPSEEGSSGVRERLRESRDQALRTLSDSPNRGAERDLLHRTAVLATVELAKSERGDYVSS
ncbi:MAG: hypothetical protein HQL60_09530 [Magnetococcales bacterium]|nr:hypothetical protein [Magnetococcales bacterium]